MPEAENAPVAAPATPAPAPAPATTGTPVDAAPAAPAAAPAPTPTEPGAPAPAPAADAPYKLEAPKDLPEGFTLDEGRLGKLNEIVAAHKLPKEAADAVLALAIEQATYQREAVAAQAEKWKADVLADPVLGKDESVAGVRKVIDTFGDDALKDLLVQTGMGNHPTVVAFVHKVAQALGEDTFISNRSTGSTEKPRDAAAVLYDNTF
jgi:hypothetical protein